jgi:putative sterol carrier protein
VLLLENIKEEFAMAMTYESIVEAARKKFCPLDVSSVEGVRAFQINIEGKAVNGIFYIEIKDGKVNVEPYEYYDRNAILTMSGTNFMKLIGGKLDPVAAFTSGKIKVDGDTNAALEMIKYVK